jgi:quercetin dioxygenase-like cupin family protein
MNATRTPNEGPAPTRAELEERLRDAGLEPRWWSNRAGDRYGWHEHGYHKVLYCLSGAIVFHTDEGNLELGPGDRLDVAPGTRHAATVGPLGVECVEAPA